MGILFDLERHFYHASIRRYVALFGSLFSDLHIKRVAEGGREEYVKVPIRYGNKNVYASVPHDETRETKKVSRVLPAMAFEITSMYKDVDRKTNPMNMIKNKTFEEDGTKKYQFNRVPYNFMFSLHLRAKNMDDMLQMTEQIIPAFDGNLSVTIEDIPNTEVQVEQDIKIRLYEIEMDDNYQDEMMPRLIDYTITFELKGHLYKRTLSAYVIREVELVGAISEFGDEFPIESTTVMSPIQGENLSVAGLVPQIDSILHDIAPLPKVERKTRKARTT